MDNNGQQGSTLGNNGQKWTKMDKNGQKWTTMDNNGQQCNSEDLDALLRERTPRQLHFGTITSASARKRKVAPSMAEAAC